MQSLTLAIIDCGTDCGVIATINIDDEVKPSLFKQLAPFELIRDKGMYRFEYFPQVRVSRDSAAKQP
jgi:hypothetical protein